MKKSTLRNKQGILTLDLVFALSLTLGGMIIVFALALTLTSVEVAQYVAFSVSRAYYPAHISIEKQENLAQAKYESLIAKPAFKALFRPNWFELKFLGARDYQSENEDIISGSHNPMSGAEIQIQAKLLAFNIPFFGRTSKNEAGLKTKVNSYLGREPSTQECLQMTAKRWKKIKENINLGEFNIGDKGYYIITDDGC